MAELLVQFCLFSPNFFTDLSQLDKFDGSLPKTLEALQFLNVSGKKILFYLLHVVVVVVRVRPITKVGAESVEPPCCDVMDFAAISLKYIFLERENVAPLS